MSWNHGDSEVMAQKCSQAPKKKKEEEETKKKEEEEEEEEEEKTKEEEKRRRTHCHTIKLEQNQNISVNWLPLY
jgi:hypothetical protein